MSTTRTNQFNRIDPFDLQPGDVIDFTLFGVHTVSHLEDHRITPSVGRACCIVCTDGFTITGVEGQLLDLLASAK